MKRFYRHLTIAALALVAVCCNSEEKNTRVEQEGRIESYLTSLSLTINENTNPASGVYRYRARVNSGGKMLSAGDMVYFYYAAYQFNTRRVEPAFHTNFPYIVEEWVEEGVNPIFWPTDPEAVRLGDNRLIKALEKGLVGCRKGDSVRLFITSDNAYGDHYVSNLPIKSAVEYTINILSEEEEQLITGR